MQSAADGAHTNMGKQTYKQRTERWMEWGAVERPARRAKGKAQHKKKKLPVLV